MKEAVVSNILGDLKSVFSSQSKWDTFSIGEALWNSYFIVSNE